MAAIVTVQVAPLVASGAVTYPIRIAGGGRPGQPYNGILGVDDWRSGVIDAPTYVTAIGFDDTGWTGGAIPQTADLEFSTSDRGYLEVMAGLYWRGARVLVHVENPYTGAMVVDMVGTVLSASVSKGRVRLVITDLSGDLSRPAVTATFAGTGGLEGGEDATGRLKRRSWGRVFNVEAQLLDKANNIYEVGDPAYGLTDIVMVKDKGLEGGRTYVLWQGSAAATLDALKAAAAPQGGAVVAPSIACIKWWTVPAGPLTADLRGEYWAGAYRETIDGVAQAIAAAVAPTTFAFQFNATRSYAVGIHCDDPNETGANLLDRLLLPCGLPWSLSPSGVITVDGFDWNMQVEYLVSQEVEREAYLPPLRSRKLGFQRNQRVQGDAEISSVLLAGPGDATYADGTPIDVLKPAEAGANVTGNHTAAGFLGQGPIATLPNLYFGSPYLLEGAGGAVATVDAFKTILGVAASIFGQTAWATLTANTGRISRLTDVGQLTAENVFLNGVAFLSDVFPGEYGANVTESRSAASITGQGALATLSAISDGFLSGNLATRLAPYANDSRYLAANRVAWDTVGGTVQDLKPGEAGANITENRSAASFYGQGALATLSSLANGGPYLSGFAALSALSFVQFGSSRTVVTSDGTTVTDSTVVTAVGVAAAVIGQGGLATIDQAGYFDLKLEELRSNTNDSMGFSYSQSLYSGTSYVPRGSLPSNADPSNTVGYARMGADQAIKAGGTIYVTINGVHQTFGSQTQNIFVALMILDVSDNILATIRMPTGTLTNYLFMVPNTFGTRTIRWRVRVMGDGNNWSAVSQGAGSAYIVDVAWKAL